MRISENHYYVAGLKVVLDNVIGVVTHGENVNQTLEEMVKEYLLADTVNLVDCSDFDTTDDECHLVFHVYKNDTDFYSDFKLIWIKVW